MIKILIRIGSITRAGCVENGGLQIKARKIELQKAPKNRIKSTTYVLNEINDLAEPGLRS